jgi:hypothetical protein
MKIAPRTSLSLARLSPAERAAILGGGFALAAALIAVFVPKACPGKRLCSLRVIDTVVADDAGQLDLEVKVINTGDRVCFIKQAVFHVTNVVTLALPQVQPRLQPVSWAYDVELPVTGAPYEVGENLSQAVEPNDIDRFLIRSGPSGTHINPHLLVMQVSLRCNEGKEAKTDRLLVYMPPTLRHGGYYNPDEGRAGIGGFSFREIADQNTDALRTVERIRAVRSKAVTLLFSRSPRLADVPDSVADQVSECERELEVGRQFMRIPVPVHHGKYQLAIKSFNKVIAECSGRYVEAALSLGAESLFLNGKYVEAAGMYQRLAQLTAANQPTAKRELLLEAAFLRDCSADAERMDAFRWAMIQVSDKEFQANWTPAEAIRLLEKAKGSPCEALRARSSAQLAKVLKSSNPN